MSNGDPVNDWKRIILAGLTLSTLVLAQRNSVKLSDVQTEARSAAQAANQAVEAARLNQPWSEPTPIRKEVK